MTIDLDSDYGEVTIEYEYDPGEPDQWYDSNGDPGTPGYGPSVTCLLYTSPSPRDKRQSRMPSSA